MIYPVGRLGTLTKHILKTPNQLENPTVLKTPETKKARTHRKPKQVESANPWIEISSRFRDPQIKNKNPIFRFRSRNRAKKWLDPPHKSVFCSTHIHQFMFWYSLVVWLSAGAKLCFVWRGSFLMMRCPCLSVFLCDGHVGLSLEFLFGACSFWISKFRLFWFSSCHTLWYGFEDWAFNWF